MSLDRIRTTSLTHAGAFYALYIYDLFAEKLVILISIKSLAGETAGFLSYLRERLVYQATADSFSRKANNNGKLVDGR